ncbi:coiled-coil domain-containing protein [Streptomyces sp. AA1529]|uniref:coiled-coil domain-containing protein n=1 Tax=Streptomyces sp. AA1529 TaxID=1203257 RepID=UPI003D74087D
MPRGRHRHSPPLHRRLPPVSVAVAALACAGGAWLIGEPGVADLETVALRALTAAAAAAAVTGAVLLRGWDRAAGKQVGDLKAQLASSAWRAEEKQADLEGEVEELRELRTKLDGRLREKRAELTGLRSEHAALLRRYANAQTERASALEGRRVLELEAGTTASAKALTTSATDHRHSSGAPTPLTYRQAAEALDALARNAVRQRAAARLSNSRAATVVPPQAPPRSRPVGPRTAARRTSGPAARDGSAAGPGGSREPEDAEGPETGSGPAGAAGKTEDAAPEPDGRDGGTGGFDFFGRSRRRTHSPSS